MLNNQIPDSFFDLFSNSQKGKTRPYKKNVLCQENDCKGCYIYRIETRGSDFDYLDALEDAREINE